MTMNTAPHSELFTTQEALLLSGISRSTLRYYISKGIVLESNQEESNLHLQRWTREQVETLQIARLLHESGTSLTAVANAAADGLEALMDMAYLESADAMRRNRRHVKAVVHRKRFDARVKVAVGQTGFYVRYVPQRWMALLPVAEGFVSPIKSDVFIEGFATLRSVAEVVGWAHTLTSGTITSLDAAGLLATRYVFCELASPPMPVATGSRIIDGGCYRVIDASAHPRCDGLRCRECSRYGRTPTPEEESAWKLAESRAGTIERTLLASSLDAPYATGVWHSYTSERVDAAARTQGDNDDGAQGGSARGGGGRDGSTQGGSSRGGSSRDGSAQGGSARGGGGRDGSAQGGEQNLSNEKGGGDLRRDPRPMRTARSAARASAKSRRPDDPASCPRRRAFPWALSHASCRRGFTYATRAICRNRRSICSASSALFRPSRTTR